jgi:hypothetical protein
MMRNTFFSNTRPSIELNIIPTDNGTWGTKACNDCSTCPEKNCY